jgi:hypothetical protein
MYGMTIRMNNPVISLKIYIYIWSFHSEIPNNTSHNKHKTIHIYLIRIIQILKSIVDDETGD